MARTNIARMYSPGKTTGAIGTQARKPVKPKIPPVGVTGSPFAGVDVSKGVVGAADMGEKPVPKQPTYPVSKEKALPASKQPTYPVSKEKALPTPKQPTYRINQEKILAKLEADRMVLVSRLKYTKDPANRTVLVSQLKNLDKRIAGQKQLLANKEKETTDQKQPTQPINKEKSA